MSIALVLVASAVDAVVWTYQAKREAEEAAAREQMRPVPVTWQEAPAATLAGEPSLVAPPPRSRRIRILCDPADPLCRP